MRQYSSDIVEISFFGLDLAPGLAEGTFIQAQQDVDTWNNKPDGVSGAIRMFNPTLSGIVTLSINGESREHQELVTISNVDRLLRVVAGPLVVYNGNTRAVTLFEPAYIKTIPNFSLGTEATIYNWRFAYSRVLTQSFGFNNNVVGA